MAAQPADPPGLPTLPERSCESSRAVRVEATLDAELSYAWLLAGILLGNTWTNFRLENDRFFATHCQQSDYADGPAHLAGVDDGIC